MIVVNTNVLARWLLNNRRARSPLCRRRHFLSPRQ